MADPLQADIVYDAGPTGCGELIMNVFRAMKNMEAGQIIEVISYDPGAKQDIPAWCRLQGHVLLELREEDQICHYFIRKE